MSRHRAIGIGLFVLSVVCVPCRADWTASGTFNYTDRLYDLGGFTGTATMPVREADVQVFDTNTMAVLASGATDTNGAFSVAVTDASTRDVGVRVLASTDQTVDLLFSVVDDSNGDAVYSYHDSSTDVNSHNSTNDVNFGTMTMPASIGPVLTTDWSSQVFNMFDMGVLLADWIAAVDGARPTVGYTTGWNPTNSRSGSFYSGGANRLSISDDDAYDDPNILHELGHYIEDEFGRSQNTGGTHFIGDDDQDPRLAWSEGFATYVSNDTLDYNERPRPDIYSDRDSFGTSGGFAYSLEPTVTGGSCNERAVNAVLYDLIDSTGTDDSSPGSDDDAVSNLSAEVWVVVEEMRTRLLPATQMDDFWDLWVELNPSSTSDVRTVAAVHSIDYVADSQEPNDRPSEATSLTVGGSYQENTFFRTGVGTAFDEDWFRFSAVSGTYYRAEVNGSANTIFGRPDPQMFLLNEPLCELIAYNDDPRDTSLNNQSSSSAQDMDETVPTILWQASETADHFLYLRHARLRRNTESRYGTYNIRVVNAGTPVPSVTSVSAQRMLAGQIYEVLVFGSNFAVDATVSVGKSGVNVEGVTWIAPTALLVIISVDGGTSDGDSSLTVTNPSAGSDTLNSAFTVNASGQPPLVISEVELGADRVEVKNIGTASATLTDWQLQGYRPGFVNATYTFPAFTLPSNATVVVYESSGTDTATELYAGPGFNWTWFNGAAGSIELIDDGGRSVDYIRFVNAYPTSHAAPTGTGGGWMQPEFQSTPSSFTISRRPDSRYIRTSHGLSGTLRTMANGGAGRQNLTDAGEDNDLPQRAKLLDQSTSLQNLYISSRPSGTDEDWFGVPVQTGDVITVSVTFEHASGNLDVELYSPGSTNPAATATTTTDDETITLVATQTMALGSGFYGLRIYGASAATNCYDLSIAGTTTSTTSTTTTTSSTTTTTSTTSTTTSTTSTTVSTTTSTTSTTSTTGDLLLAITSPYGTGVPPIGPSMVSSGTVITASIIDSPVTVTDLDGFKTYACTGWVGTGSAPVFGVGTNTGSFTMTEDSSVSWLWGLKSAILSNFIETGIIIIDAEETIRAGDQYYVLPPGMVTLEAGESIRLIDGFHAASGSVFRATIDP